MKLTVEQVKRLIEFLPDDLEVTLKLPANYLVDNKNSPPSANPRKQHVHWNLVDTQWPPVNLNNQVPAYKFPTN